MTSKYTLVPAASIIVPSKRQRVNYPKEHIRELSESIREDCLIHAPTVTDGLDLIAGFCRREAVLLLNSEYEYGGEKIPAGFIPVIIATGKSPIELARIELAENLRRKSLTPVEEAKAIADLHAMMEALNPGNWTKEETGRELARMRGEEFNPGMNNEVASNLIINSFADDADVQRATSRNEALKIAKKKLEAIAIQGLGALTTIRREDFKLIEGNCLEVLPTLEAESFAGIISDPPYGISAEGFGDQAYHSGHSYVDDLDSALRISREILHHGFRITKPDAHLYMFCDIRVWPSLFKIAAEVGWQVYATPLIWHKPNAGHAPQPGFFTRRYECILFARRGERKLVSSASDVMSFASVTSKVYAAEKPVELLTHLLKLSFFPGETVLDPTCGSGSIFAAAKAAGLRAVGIEQLPEAINISRNRIGEL